VLNDELEITDAVIVTELGLGISKGAVYCAPTFSVGVIAPTARLPFSTPFTDQVIRALLTPVTVAVSCCVLPARTVNTAGEMAMLWPAVPVDGCAFFEPAKPAQLVVRPIQTITMNRANPVRNSFSCDSLRDLNHLAP